MKKYEIIVSGTTVTTVNTKEEAEKKLNEIKHSFLAIVHPVNAFYIRESEDWKILWKSKKRYWQTKVKVIS